MQRSDQYMVNFYERVGKAAMDRKLLVDFMVLSNLPAYKRDTPM